MKCTMGQGASTTNAAGPVPYARSRSGVNSAPIASSVNKPRSSDPAVDNARRSVDLIRGFFVDLGAIEGIDAVNIEIPTGPRDRSEVMYDGDRDTLVLGRPSGATESAAYAEDIIAHEFAHRVLAATIGAGEADGEQGAVQEHLADVFAAAFDNDDWMIGEDIVTGGVRNMEDGTRFSTWTPGDRQQNPTTRDEYNPALTKHENAAILNRAAVVMSEALGEGGRTITAQLYWHAIERGYITRDTGLDDAAAAVMQAANDVLTPAQQKTVRDSWGSLGFLTAR